ncbi:CRISPR-associated protein Csd1 [Frankia sp. AiPs1]|uniref:type I-C CRISPR-associated protein Cas8c/Csd1 n=1 Tax=Frankia sp. AiPa1 TaxID=573492 RepID=UPI00202ADD9B|nr:type I-C CRISPR-associated protein Cas8c/Csd1 [Frankia sp. AiPa1]MCL9757919.1 type I-C CRISPR-associated protein Cas8c/Csd1 [Frankia sp. AiPa1]
MLLARLAAFEQPVVVGFEDAALPPFFQVRPMKWGLRVTSSGELGASDLIDLSDSTDRARKNGEAFAVPYIARAAGISPLLGADDIQYALGWADDAAKPDRVAKCHAASIALVQGWARAAPDDPVAQACARFYQTGAYAAVARPATWTSKQGVILLVGADAHPVTEEPSLRAYWGLEVQRRKAGGGSTGTDGDDSGSGGQRRGPCLVCGRVAVLVDRFPQQIPRRLVPGCTQASAALVSANKRIHTYDFGENLTTVPICLDCAQRSVANLQYLLDDTNHAFVGGDSRMTWWTIDSEFDLTSTLGNPPPALVTELINRTRTGAGPAKLDQRERFCSVTISGNVSRVVVRDWIDMPLPALEANIGRWFEDHRMLGVDTSREGYLPLVRLELATGRWIPTRAKGTEAGTGLAGEYARFGAKNAQRPDDVQRHLLRTAIKGFPLPPALFAHLLTRIRTDGHIDDPRAALIRLALVRRARPRTQPERTFPVPGPGLDPDNHDPAYLAGRVFAQLETIQYYAARVGRKKEDRLNATFADRYLAGAIANPAASIIQGQKLAQPWLKKIGRGRPDTAIALGRQLSDLFAMFHATGGLPGRATLDEQGRFVLGYHHHKSDSMRRGQAANAAKLTPPPAGPATPGATAQPPAA